MNENWLPYPANLPEKDGEYLVTLNYEKKYVTISRFQSEAKRYSEDDEFFVGPVWHDIPEGGLYGDFDVIAFMQKPKPYDM